MSSAITTIYSNIESWDVYYDSDIVPKVWGINDHGKFTGEIVNSLPVRILSVISPESGVEDVSEIGLNSGQMEVSWFISDLLLIVPTAHGGSLRNVAPDMITYQTNYLDALSSNWGPTSQSWVESARMERGVFIFPEGGDPYYGIETILEVHEVF